MSATQALDLIVNFLGFGALVWLSAATVVRWISRGRLEAYSVDSLLPKGFATWMRSVLALTFVITPAPSETDSGAERFVWGITPVGWLCFGCVAVWLAVKAV